MSVCFPIEEKDSHADVMAAFRQRFHLGLERLISGKSKSVGEDSQSSDATVLCFKVVVEHHKSKRGARARTIYVTAPDDASVEDVLAFLAPLLDADPATCLFMTSGAYGIPSAQSASSMFMKYGNDLTMRTGVHMSSVAWHLRA